MKYTIAIVDDHVLIANALKSIISNFNQYEVILVCLLWMVLTLLYGLKKTIQTF